MTKKIDTKKTFKPAILTSESKQALNHLKDCIKQDSSNFHRFVSSAVYLCLNSEYTIKTLRDIAKTKVQDWDSVKGWLNQKLQCASILIEKKKDSLTNKTESEILDFLTVNKLTKNAILSLNKTIESSKDESAESSKDESAESDEEKTPALPSFDSVCRWLESATKQEKNQIRLYFATRGYVFELREAKKDELKEAVNLYK